MGQWRRCSKAYTPPKTIPPTSALLQLTMPPHTVLRGDGLGSALPSQPPEAPSAVRTFH